MKRATRKSLTPRDHWQLFLYKADWASVFWILGEIAILLVVLFLIF